MPVTKSAIKAMKQNRKANARNKQTKADFKAKLKTLRKAVDTDSKALGKLASEAIQALDKAAKKGVIHKNTASRRKSRLMKAIVITTGKSVDLTTTKEKPKASVKTEKPAKKPKNTTSTTKKPTPKKTTAK